MKIKSTTLILILILLISTSCGTVNIDTDQAAQETPVPLMVLPPELSAVSSSLTSTLTIYSSTVTQIYHKSLTFSEDSDGNDIVVSPALSLEMGTHYRFVIVFYWNDVIFAYVDTVIQIPETDESEISYETADITYDTSDPNSSLASPSLYQQTSGDLAINSLTIEPSEDGDSLSFEMTVDTQRPLGEVSYLITDQELTVAYAQLSQGQQTKEGYLSFNSQIDITDLEEKNYLLVITALDEFGEETTLTLTLGIQH